MITESIDYERTDLPSGRILLNDIIRTYSIHGAVIKAAFPHPIINSAAEFVAVYLEGEYKVARDDHSTQNLSGHAIHIPYTPHPTTRVWGRFHPITGVWEDIKLLGSRAIELPGDIDFYYFKVGSKPPTDPNYRQDTTEVERATFAVIPGTAPGPGRVAFIDRQSSTNDKLSTLSSMHPNPI